MKRCKSCHRTKDLMKNGASYYKNRHGETIVYPSFICHSCLRDKCRRYIKTKNGSIKTQIRLKKSRARYPWKNKARILLRRAVEAGKIKKPIICSKCNLRRKIAAHHTDYSKPFKVMWVCYRCHSKIHRNMV